MHFTYEPVAVTVPALRRDRARPALRLSSIFVVTLIAILPDLAAASSSSSATSRQVAALDRAWSAGAYGTSWHGSYGGQGLGGVVDLR